MNILTDETIEVYAVEIPGLGYWRQDMPHTGSITNDPDEASVEDLPRAVHALESAKQSYKRLGMDSVGNTALIVHRTITLTRSEWAPAALPTPFPPLNSTLSGAMT